MGKTIEYNIQRSFSKRIKNFKIFRKKIKIFRQKCKIFRKKTKIFRKKINKKVQFFPDDFRILEKNKVFPNRSQIFPEKLQILQ